MAIVRNSLKNGKVSVTSSYFEDARLVKASLRDSLQSDYVPSKWRREKGRDFSQLKLATAAQFIYLNRLGVMELSEFVDNLKPSQYENYKINYGPWKEYESYEDLEKKREELLEIKGYRALEEDENTELERVTKEIADIDKFVEENTARALDESISVY